MIRMWLCAISLVIAVPLGHAQTPRPATQGEPASRTELALITSKFNAYVALMNRTLRASESIERYESWVDMKTGPVNKNRAFGVYELYDVTDEVAEAKEALAQEPKLATLDGSMNAYIQAYSDLAPIIDEANTYYERKEYLDDNLGRGRQIHARLMPAAKAFRTARERIEQDFRTEKANLDQRELVAIEGREGRKANWHRTNLMLAARHVMDRLPSNEHPVVDVAALDTDVTGFINASKDFEDYKKSDPNALKSLRSGITSFLAAARDFRDAMKSLKGDARRGGGQQLQGLVNAYNAMAGSANNAAN